MNKRQAIAYAQVALDYMQSSKYKGELNPQTLGLEMKQAFRMYPLNIILNIAESQSFSRKKLIITKRGSDTNE